MRSGTELRVDGVVLAIGLGGRQLLMKAQTESHWIDEDMPPALLLGITIKPSFKYLSGLNTDNIIGTACSSAQTNCSIPHSSIFQDDVTEHKLC